MKHLILKSLTALAAALVVLAQLQFSSNPPIDRTNRQSGSNCTGCHSGSLNPSGGSLSLTGTASYYPGKVYTIGVSVTGGSIYGFEMTAVRSSNTNTGAGVYSGTGFNTTTQSGRSYARHNPKLTSGTWSVTWTAPSSNVGNVTMYATGVAANNNSNTFGDKTYASTKTLTALDLISFDMDTVHVSCNGGNDGKLKVRNISGGTGAPYTFSWSGSSVTADSITGLTAGSYTVTVSDNDNNSETRTVTITQPAAINANISHMNTLCGDSTGAARAFPTGGTGSLSVTWQTGITVINDTAKNLSAGTYYVTISDANQCTKVDSVVIGTSGSNIKMTLSSSPEFCNNGWGEAMVTNISGAQAPVSYTWSNSQSGQAIDSLSAGNYIVTATDNAGCTATGSIVVAAQSNTITSQLSVVNDKCNQLVGSMKAATPGGGILPYSYSWSNNATGDSIGGLSAGVYFVTISDSVGCSVTLSDTVKDEDAPILSVSGTDLLCFGDSSGIVRSMVSGGTRPYDYNWSDGSNRDSITGLGAGTYVLTVSDANSCTTIDSVTLSQPTLLEVDTIYQATDNDSTCDEHAFVRGVGGTSAYSYLWNDPNASTDTLALNLCAGTYEVTITDANGCLTTANVEVIDRDITGIDVLERWGNIKVFPNPFNSMINITGLMDQELDFKLVNVSGRVVKATQLTGNTTIDVSELESGIYILELGNEYRIRLIK